MSEPTLLIDTLNKGMASSTIEKLAYDAVEILKNGGGSGGGGGGSSDADTAISALLDGSITTLTTGATSLCANALRSREDLVKVDLTACTSIGSGAFTGCDAIETFIIRTNQVCTAVSETSIPPLLRDNDPESGVFLYVPESLVSSYQAATNWSAIADVIRAIEDYPDITGG